MHTLPVSPGEPGLTLTVPPELDGARLDVALARLCPQHSRARLQAWIRAGRVAVDGRRLRARDAVRAGARLSVQPEDLPREGEPEAEPIPLNVLHEDEALIVLDKPPGLVVHPGAGNRAHTLQNALLHYDPRLRHVPRAGIVQRLDKDTSGIMVVARTPEAHTFLVRALKERTVRRRYLAIVNGAVTAGGTVSAPIGRHPRDRRRMAVVAGGREAVTHYRVRQRFAAHTLLEVNLETGRTHQIRVHMAHLRHPVLGDPAYGGRPRLPPGASPALRATLQSFRRQALHASELALSHPLSGKAAEWQAPLPADMANLIGALARENP
jgi:23S rRNA pseudouridine1911/1915/1917 synthase